MNLPLGMNGNNAVKFLATMRGIDPHDSHAVAEMILGLVDAATKEMLVRVRAADPAPEVEVKP